jgi:hypothetical protein
MSLFYQSICDLSDKKIAFIGGGGKSALIYRISQELKKKEKKVLVVSRHPIYVPPDTGVFISNDINIILQRVPKELEEQGVVYLGASIDEKALAAFNEQIFHAIISKVTADHILIEADHTHGRSVSGFDKLKQRNLNHAERCVLVIGADALNQPCSEMFIKTRDNYWRNRLRLEPDLIADWLMNHKIMTHINEQHIPITVFINKVENMLFKNMSIGFARQLKQLEIDRVFYGSVFNSEINPVR